METSHLKTEKTVIHGMGDIALHIADVFFVVFHTALTLFNAIGWIWKKTRKINLITLTLTGMSWFILGLFYGIGYCPFTEWHFKILRALGQHDLPTSYIEYLVERITPFNPSPALVDTVTAGVFFLALGLSVFLNVHDQKLYRQIRKNP